MFHTKYILILIVGKRGKREEVYQLKDHSFYWNGEAYMGSNYNGNNQEFPLKYVKFQVTMTYHSHFVSGAILTVLQY